LNLPFYSAIPPGFFTNFSRNTSWFESAVMLSGRSLFSPYLAVAVPPPHTTSTTVLYASSFGSLDLPLSTHQRLKVSLLDVRGSFFLRHPHLFSSFLFALTFRTEGITPH